MAAFRPAHVKFLAMLAATGFVATGAMAQEVDTGNPEVLEAYRRQA